MQDEKTPDDEIALYILCKMYRRHIFVFTRKWWWTSLLYMMPTTADELIPKCDRTLVFINPGIFGEIKSIRAPDPKTNIPVPLTSKSTQDDVLKKSTGMAMDEPSRRASRSRIRKLPCKRREIDYKKLADVDTLEEEKSPSKK